jgi:hypothetical protein
LAMDHIHIDVGKRDGDYEDDNQWNCSIIFFYHMEFILEIHDRCLSDIWHVCPKLNLQILYNNVVSSLSDPSSAVIIAMIVKDCGPVVSLNLYSRRWISMFRRNVHISATSPEDCIMAQP